MIRLEKYSKLLALWVGIFVSCPLAASIEEKEEAVEIGGRSYPLRTTKIDIFLSSLNTSLPETIGKLINLAELTIYTRHLRGEIPVTLTHLINLTWLNLKGNQLTGSIPKKLGHLTKLENLDFSNNQLTGHIPLSLGSLSCLKRLSLERNQLSGTIPFTFGYIQNLTWLDLSHNQLTGKLPKGLLHLKDLTVLQLAYNQLTGSIPENLGALACLNVLKLNNNHLSGKIPNTLGNLTKLNLLDLSNNQLKGSIPESLGTLTNLENLDLSNNQLTGLFSNLLKLKLYDLNLKRNYLNILDTSKECKIEVKFQKGTLGVGGKTFDPKMLYKFEKTCKNFYLDFSITGLNPDHPFFLLNNTVATFSYLDSHTLSLMSVRDEHGKIQRPTQLQKDIIEELNQAARGLWPGYNIKKADP